MRFTFFVLLTTLFFSSCAIHVYHHQSSDVGKDSEGCTTGYCKIQRTDKSGICKSSKECKDCKKAGVCKDCLGSADCNNGQCPLVKKEGKKPCCKS